VGAHSEIPIRVDRQHLNFFHFDIEKRMVRKGSGKYRARIQIGPLGTIIQQLLL